MKRVKKFMVLSLVISMMMMMLACGKEKSDGAAGTKVEGDTNTTADKNESAVNETNGEKIVLHWWVWASVDIANQMAQAVFDANPEFAEKYEIEAVLIPSATELVQKFRMMLASGETMPEIMMFQTEFLPEFAQDGILTNVTDVLAPYKEKMTTGSFNLVTYDNNQWGFPYQIKPSVWVYRSDMFAKAGIDVNTVKTTEDFIAAGKKLQQAYPNSYMWQFNSMQFPYAQMVHILSGNGGCYFDKDGNYILDSDPAVRATWEDIKKVYDSGIVYDVVADSVDQQQGYADGTIASDLTGSWIKNNMQKWAPDLKGLWEEAQWPSIGGGTPGGEGGSMWVMPDNSKYHDEAIEFMKVLSLTVEGNLNAYKQRAIYPSLVEATQNDLIKEPHNYMGASLYEAEAQAVENFKSFKYSPKFNSEMEIITQYFAEYLQGKKTLDDALSAANNDLSIQLGNAFAD